MLKLQNKIPSALTIGGKIVERIKMRNEVVWEKVQLEYFYIESLGDGNTVSVVNVVNESSGISHTPTLEYSTDKNIWNTITFNTSLGTHTTELPIKLNTGGKMYFRNDTGKFSSSNNKYISFLSSVASNVGGDIRTLSNYLDVNSETTPKSNMFINLFYNNKFIVDASNLRLPYTTLASNCYSSMFSGCTSLTTAPELPATTLADYCYFGMFKGCTSLTTAPTLPATTLASDCYSYMLSGCTSLTTAPELSATTLAFECYGSMFEGCKSLTTAPTLPATTLARFCYEYMFQNCTSLTTAPELPATTLVGYCYDGMFEGCTSLVNAPALPATTLADFCYDNRSLLGLGDEEFDDEAFMFKDLTDEKLRALTQKIFSTKEIKEAFRRQMPDSVYTFNVLLTLEVTLKAVPNGNYEVEYCAIIGGPHKRKTKMTKLSRLFSKGEGDMLKNTLIDKFKKINSRSF